MLLRARLLIDKNKHPFLNLMTLERARNNFPVWHPNLVHIRFDGTKVQE